MHLSKKDGNRPFFVGGMLVALVFVGSPHLFAQSATSEVVGNPIEVKGTAQANVVGLTPSQVRHAYGFDLIPNQGAGQTIAVIEAFGDQSVEKDLGIFDQTFNLPPCTTANGCLQVLSANGKNLGNGSGFWPLETALDVEWAHAIAPEAKIMVVEAPLDHLDILLQAVDFAVSQGATVVSMSWGGLQFVGEDIFDSHFAVPNVSFVAGSGDFPQFGPLYPASSPYVLAVGGTTLNISDSLGTYGGEVAWSSSEGGQAFCPTTTTQCGVMGSITEPEPSYQKTFPIPNDSAGARGNPDVAYNADPNTGFAVFTTRSSVFGNGWIQVAGTSAGTPQWSALIAIAKSMGWSPAALTGTNSAIYSAAKGKSSYSQNFHDVTAGSNGTCGTLCTAGPGYDYVTGIGSPQANNLVNALLSSQ